MLADRKIPVMCAMHPDDIESNPKMRVPEKVTWNRVRQYLDGEWPKPWADIVHVPSLLYANVPTCAVAVIDCEWNRETKQIYQIGVYYGKDVYIWSCSEEKDMSLLRDVHQTFREWKAKKVTLVFHNAASDFEALGISFGLSTRDVHIIEDTIYMMALVWAELPKNLVFCSSMYGDHLHVKTLGEGSFEYLRGDLQHTWDLCNKLYPTIHNDKQSADIYRTMIRLIPCLVDNARKGVRVNTGFVEKIAEEYSSVIADALAHVGDVLMNGPQIPDILAEAGIPLGKTATGRWRLTKDDVERLAQEYDHPILQAKAKYIQVGKLYSSYIDPLINDGVPLPRVYPTILPFAQATGRWSIIEPPISQLPKELKPMLIPDEGETWVCWDWDGIEIRIIAAETGDQLLLSSINDGVDLHTVNFCHINNVPLPSNLQDPHTAPEDAAWRASIRWEGKDDRRRTDAKAYMFGLFYGAYDKEGWAAHHPRIREHWDRIKQEVRCTGTSTSFLGRKRRLLDDRFHRKLKQAYNHPMQAAVADILNECIVTLWEATFKDGGRLVTTTFDSVKWGIPTEKLDRLLPIIQGIAQPTYVINGREMYFAATFNIQKGWN